VGLTKFGVEQLDELIRHRQGRPPL
jgi:hypothetical protein